MLEAVLIYFIYLACSLFPLRGKQYSELTAAQQNKLNKYHTRFMRTKKGRQSGMTEEQYLPVLQKQALMSLILAIVILPVYVLCVIFLYKGILY